MFKFLSRPPYKVGVALSGGGARGFAHVGALKALEDMGIKPDIIAGVSAGSIVAAMYAAGIKADRMLDLFKSAKFTDFAEFRVPRDGFFSLERFKKLLEDIIPYRNIEDLPTPIVIGATDFDNGVKVAFDHGPIAERVLASASIPIVFTPVVIDGIRYVDGGVLHNLPAWAIRDKCKYLIGINCSPLVNGRPPSSIIEVAMRSYHLMLRSNTESDIRLCDTVVQTQAIGRHNVFDLNDIDRVYLCGYNDTMRMLLDNGFKRPDRVAPQADAEVPADSAGGVRPDNIL